MNKRQRKKKLDQLRTQWYAEMCVAYAIPSGIMVCNKSILKRVNKYLRRNYK